MRSVSDPIRAIWLRSVAAGVIGLGICVAIGFWAFTPIAYEPADPNWAPRVAQPDLPSDPSQSKQQQAVYETKLWTPPPPVEPRETAAATKARPVRPSRLVLIGIVTPDGPANTEYEAILYDPDTDSTHIARPGEQVGGIVIGAITAESAELGTQPGAVELTLDTGRQADRG